MPTIRRLSLCALALTLMVTLPVAAQAPTSGSDRLFLSFFEDATIIDSQWWEGQIDYADYDDFNTLLVRGVAAFNPRENLEVGGRVGFGSSDADMGIDGSGATDLDVYGKWHFGARPDGKTEFAAGAIVTVPTGDDSVGLGFDAFALGGFGSMRYRLADAILTGNVGFRMNDDARIFGVDIDGELSPFVGLGYIRPLSDEVTFVGELRFESERFDGGSSDVRALGGINLRAFNRGMLRAAVGVGLDDGAPDIQFIVGYAQTF
jgi:hypothetical protein